MEVLLCMRNIKLSMRFFMLQLGKNAKIMQRYQIAPTCKCSSREKEKKKKTAYVDLHRTKGSI